MKEERRGVQQSSNGKRFVERQGVGWREAQLPRKAYRTRIREEYLETGSSWVNTNVGATESLRARM